MAGRTVCSWQAGQAAGRRISASPGRGDCFWWASRGEKGLIGPGGGPVPCPHPRVGLLQACHLPLLPLVQLSSF